MQRILSLNLSTNPIEAQLVLVQEGQLQVLESYQAEISEDFNKLLRDKIVLGDKADLDVEFEEHTRVLSTLINSFSEDWSSSVLLIPGDDSLSLELKLPFSGRKEINRVINLEVQDLVPFDIQDFVIDYTVLGANQASDSNLYDIYVALMPRNYLANIIGICKKCNFEPLVITTPASAMAAVYYLSPEYFSENFSFLYMTESACYTCAVFNGKVRADRIFKSNWLAISSQEQLYMAQLQEFKVALASLENQYACNVDKVYVLQSHLPRPVLQNALARDVVLLDSSDIIKGAGANNSNSADSTISAAATIFVRDLAPFKPLANFRTGEFAFRPQLKQLINATKYLAPLFALSFILIFGYFLSNYLMNEYQIKTINSAIAEQIQKVAPELDSSQYNTLNNLNSYTQSMEEDLAKEGAPSVQQPLDILLHLSKEFKKHSTVKISSISISNVIVTILGFVDSYSNADKLERALRRDRDIFCKVTANPNRVATGVNLNYTIELCN
jgi:hypothetical protein